MFSQIDKTINNWTLRIKGCVFFASQCTLIVLQISIFILILVIFGTFHLYFPFSYQYISFQSFKHDILKAKDKIKQNRIKNNNFLQIFMSIFFSKTWTLFLHFIWSFNVFLWILNQTPFDKANIFRESTVTVIFDTFFGMFLPF